MIEKDRFEKLIEKSNNKELLQILNKLGKLSDNSYKSSLLKLTNHDKYKIRLLAIKNLAKLKDFSLLDNYLEIVNNDKSSDVRRETVSAIGRLRDKKTIPVLMEILNDLNPEIVMQAIRGLLVFKKENEVKNKLEELKNHPNEIIKEIINIEINGLNEKKKLLNHPESLNCFKNTVVQGDVLKILQKLPEESMHLTFTSPPYYNAKDYSIYKSYKEYLSFLEKVFKEVHRITKEGRFFILNTSPIIIPRFSRAHSSKRYPIPYDIHAKLVNIGWEFIDDIIWVKPEASVKNRVGGFHQHRKPLAYKPNTRNESVMVYRKKTKKLLDWNIKQYDKNIIEKSKVIGEYDTNNIWEIDSSFDKTHSAVFPKKLCEKIIKYYSFVGDVVFDPFAGSGTFGFSALNLDRYFFLTEIKNNYIERIKEVLSSSKVIHKKFKKPRFLNIKELTKEIEDELNIIRNSREGNNKKIT